MDAGTKRDVAQKEECVTESVYTQKKEKNTEYITVYIEPMQYGKLKKQESGKREKKNNK